MGASLEAEKPREYKKVRNEIISLRFLNAKNRFLLFTQNHYDVTLATLKKQGSVVKECIMGHTLPHEIKTALSLVTFPTAIEYIKFLQERLATLRSTATYNSVSTSASTVAAVFRGRGRGTFRGRSHGGFRGRDRGNRFKYNKYNKYDRGFSRSVW